MIGYPQSQLLWETVHIAAYLTQRKLNAQEIIVYTSEKQDKIPKNKPKKKKVEKKNCKLRVAWCELSFHQITLQIK